MGKALALAQEAFDAGEIPIGAVVVWDDKIIGRGRNMTEQLQDVTAHAELIAITAATNHIGAKYLNEATIYVTIEPCLMCSGALYWSKIGHVVYGAEDEKNGYRKSANTPFHPRTTITTGILATECAQLMKDFFKRRR